MRPEEPAEAPAEISAPAPSALPATAWAWFFGIGFVGAVFYLLVPGGIPQDVVYQLYGLAAAVAILVGVHRFRPARRLPWYLMAAGQALWWLADGAGNVDVDVLGNDRFPSPADPFYLLGYVVTGVSLLLLIRIRAPRGDVGGWLDSAIFTVSLGVLAWVLLAEPVIGSNSDSWLAATIGATYPYLDIVLAGLLIRLVTIPGGLTRALRLLAYALIALVCADTLAEVFHLATPSRSEPLEPLWLLSYSAWGAAALDRTMVGLTEPAEAKPPTFSRVRLALLTLAVLVPSGILAVENLAGGPINVWAVVIGSVTLFLLVMARVGVAVQQIQWANRARQVAQDALAHQASHDALTGLPNRAQSLALIRGALGRAQRSGNMIGLLLIDLDGFKPVNDNFGHVAGDEVLYRTGQRMQACVRTGDVVGRLGGDEFIVLLEPLEEEQAAVPLAERVVAAVGEPLDLSGGREVIIGASVGVAIAQDAPVDPDRLLAEADVALYRAKLAGRGRVEVFDRSLREELDRQAALERALSAAIRSADLTLRHEPIVDLLTQDVIGHEAQVGWPRPGADELLRADVLAVAERTELICDLDAWVLREAAAQVAAVPADARVRLLAVPVSGRHLHGPQIVADVTDAFGGVGLDLSILVLIVQQADLIDDPGVLERLTTLRRTGVRICVDGFGAHEGPTSRWGQLPIDLVRIDPVSMSGVSLRSTMLLQLTVETAHTFGCGVIAAGVSDPDLLPVLADAGCEFAQGPLSRRLATVRSRPS